MQKKKKSTYKQTYSSFVWIRYKSIIQRNYLMSKKKELNKNKPIIHIDQRIDTLYGSHTSSRIVLTTTAAWRWTLQMHLFTVKSCKTHNTYRLTRTIRTGVKLETPSVTHSAKISSSIGWKKLPEGNQDDLIYVPKTQKQNDQSQWAAKGEITSFGVIWT